MTTQGQAGKEGAEHAIEPRSAADTIDGALLERVVVGGDLSKLSPNERLRYYRALCESVGLDPVTAGFQYLYLQGRMVLYASRQTTEHLRVIHGVSITKMESSLLDGIYTVVAYGHDKTGRTDAATGAVSVEGKRGQEKADLVMKCETKAKRRLTLSLCGLGILDESEVEVPLTAVTATEVVKLNLPDAAPIEAQSDVLFPHPEADRAGLIQRARIAMARSNKARVAKLKETWCGDPTAELEKVDLAALVSLVRELEEEKL